MSVGGSIVIAGLFIGAAKLGDQMRKTQQALESQAEKAGYSAAQFEASADTNRDGIVSFDEEVAFLRRAGFSDNETKGYFSGQITKEEAVNRYEALPENQR